MKPLTILGAVLAAILLAWFATAWVGFSGDVGRFNSTLHDVVAAYGDVGNAHMTGVVAAAAAAGQEPDGADARALADAFSAVASAATPNDQLRTVDALEKRLGMFFEVGRPHAASLAADQDFVALNQEITGRGRTSGPVQEYNKAAAAIRENMKEFPGGMLGGIYLGGEPPFLWLDGKPKDIKVMM